MLEVWNYRISYRYRQIYACIYQLSVKIHISTSLIIYIIIVSYMYLLPIVKRKAKKTKSICHACGRVHTRVLALRTCNWFNVNTMINYAWPRLSTARLWEYDSTYCSHVISWVSRMTHKLFLVPHLPVCHSLVVYSTLHSVCYFLNV